MISHVALYRFKSEITNEDLEGFGEALNSATRETNLDCRITLGPHVGLPADAAVPDAVYSFTAVWEFPSLADLDTFSKHPAIVEFEREWASTVVEELAIANHHHGSRVPGEKVG